MGLKNWQTRVRLLETTPTLHPSSSAGRHALYSMVDTPVRTLTLKTWLHFNRGLSWRRLLTLHPAASAGRHALFSMVDTPVRSLTLKTWLHFNRGQFIPDAQKWWPGQRVLSDGETSLCTSIRILSDPFYHIKQYVLVGILCEMRRESMRVTN